MARNSRVILEQNLAIYKQEVDAIADTYTAELLSDYGQHYTAYSRAAAEIFCTILQRGGKRLRGALVMNTYEMLGGGNRQLALRAALAIEIIHTYLLIIDDICDRSLMRRGGPTAHVMLTERHRQLRLKGDSEHFGLSQAINVAILGAHLAQRELTQLPTTDSSKLEVLHDLNSALITTIHGQINDLYNQSVQEVNESEVKQTLAWKTTDYSFKNPLQMGAILAQAGPESGGLLDEYAGHAGLAFQISDDILGTFGSSFESGKSAHDDMKEGKITILVSRALERADSQQRQALLKALGNQQLTPADLEKCRQIIEATGALDYARRVVHKHAAEAVQVLDSAPDSWSPGGVMFMRELARFITERVA